METKYKKYRYRYSVSASTQIKILVLVSVCEKVVSCIPTSGLCQLIANVRYVDEDKFTENFLFSKELDNHATGDEIFRVTDEYLTNHDLSWDMCVGVCT